MTAREAAMLAIEEKIALVERALFEPLLNDKTRAISVSDTWVQAIAPDVPTELRNRVYRSVLREDEVDARIAETIALYRSNGAPFQWIVSPLSRPASLPERLLKAGLTRAFVASGMFAETMSVRLMPKNPEVTVEPLHEGNLEDWAHLQIAGWGMPGSVAGEIQARTEQRLQTSGQAWLAFIGRVGGAPAGGISMSICDGYAHIADAIVLPEHQRHRVARTLFRGLIDILRERGVAYATSHGISETSAAPLQKVGFEPVCELVYYRYRP
jgi:ribosomal protein S18 acetylase RimI-like enzyme